MLYPVSIMEQLGTRPIRYCVEYSAFWGVYSWANISHVLSTNVTGLTSQLAPAGALQGTGEGVPYHRQQLPMVRGVCHGLDYLISSEIYVVTM